MELDGEQILKIIVAILFLLAGPVSRLLKGKARLGQGEEAGGDGDGDGDGDGVETAGDIEDEGLEPEWAQAEQVASVPQAQPDPWDILAPSHQEALTRAAQMAKAFVYERPNRRFLHTVESYVPEQLGLACRELQDRAPESVERGALRLADVELVLAVVEEMARQRRDQQLMGMLGDADRLAEACYRPVLDFAQAQGLSVASSHPVAALGSYQLTIWTGLIPTSLAPIFLPARFFSSVWHWPAIAHEIGHDFIASLHGFEQSLRDDLELPLASDGVPLLPGVEQGLQVDHLEQLFAAWLEEIFCDVFGTMMIGPAYVSAMIELFAQTAEPGAVITVDRDPRLPAAYDPHPPRHLRVLVACKALEHMGLARDGERLQQDWNSLHMIDGEAPSFLVIPTRTAPVGIDLTLFAAVTHRLVERIYRGPLGGLKASGLRDIAGLDYGPDRHNETQRATEGLLAGRVPDARDPRSIIGGAVLATCAEPDREGELLQLARSMIPAMGTLETVPLPYEVTPAMVELYPQGPNSAPMVDAVVFAEVFAPPLAHRRRRLG